MRLALYAINDSSISSIFVIFICWLWQMLINTAFGVASVRREWLNVSRTLEVVMLLFQAEDGIRDWSVTGVQTCALPICQVRRDGQVKVGGIGVTFQGIYAGATQNLTVTSNLTGPVGPGVTPASVVLVNEIPGEIGRASCRERA